MRNKSNKELLFAFKKRVLVHLAVDDEEVYMTTRIDGNRTYWLPFNKGHNKGKGNPPNLEGYRTEYLWQDILVKDSWLEIIGRFVHLQTEEYEFEGRTRKKEKLIFPRFHQLGVVREQPTMLKKTVRVIAIEFNIQRVLVRVTRSL